MSPDGKWALAQVSNQVYLLAVPRMGGEAPTVDVSKAVAFRCAKITDSRRRLHGMVRRRRQDDHLGRRLHVLPPASSTR